jgi:hypothetical protein
MFSRNAIILTGALWFGSCHSPESDPSERQLACLCQPRVVVKNPTQLDSSMIFALSPDGSLFTHRADADTIAIRTTSMGKAVSRIECPTKEISGVVFRADNSNIITAHSDGTLRMWCITSGKCLQQIQGHAACIVAMTDVHGDELFATGDSQGTIRLWKLDRHFTVQGEVHAHEGPVNTLAISPSRRILFSGGVDGLIRLWDLSSLRMVDELAGHLSHVESIKVSSDGTFFASVGRDDSIILWESETRQKLRRFELRPGFKKSAAFSPIGEYFGFTSTPEQVLILRLPCCRKGYEIQLSGPCIGNVYFSPSSIELVTACTNGLIQFWPLHPKEETMSTRRQLDVQWREVGTQDPETAYAAFAELSARPTEVIDLIKKNLETALTQSSNSIEQLIIDLNADDPKSRERAQKSILRLGRKDDALIEQALQTPLPAEVRVRLTDVLSILETSRQEDPETILWLRTTYLLSLIRHPDCRLILQELSNRGRWVQLRRKATFTLHDLDTSGQRNR